MLILISRLFLCSTLCLVLLSQAIPTYAQESPPQPERLIPSYYRANVTKISPYIDEQAEASSEQPTDSIFVEMRIQDKERLGDSIKAPWSNNQQLTRSFQIKEGDKLLVTCRTLNGNESCDIMERQRTSGLAWLMLTFVAITWLVTRAHGLRAISTILLGLAVILFVIIPLILNGVPPLPVTVIGGLAILIPTIYISHGFNTKSHIALVSIMAAVVVIGILSLVFTNVLQLTGSTGDETNYLNPAINLRAILLSAILLGALGVIDDIAMTQVSIVNELYHSNSKLSSLGLFTRAMQVGRDHIASVINTLFLAYASISLPLLILIQQNDLPAFIAFQQEPIATEIMRTLIGTIGLILVVPLTTYIASQAIRRRPDLFPAEEHHHAH